MKKILGILFLIFVLIGFVNANTLTIWPNAQGYYSNWINSGCSSGSSEWQCVDETFANTSDNLYTNAKNTYESFAFQDTGFTNEIVNSITLYFYGQRYSSNRYQFQPLIRISNANYLGSLKSLTPSYDSYSETYTINPATGLAWTIDEVNALESGMKSYTSNYGGRIAQVYAVIDYSIPNSCSDSDGGMIPETFGNVTGYLDNNYFSNSDYCVDSGNIAEYFCNGTSKQNQAQSCGTDNYVGNDYCLSGDVYRNYTDYSCGSGVCYSGTSAILQQDCVSGQSCSNGQCVWENSCSDSDGGIIPETFGNVTGYSNQSYYNYNDYCLSNTTILEFSCVGNNFYNSGLSCAGNSTSICSNGRCI